MNFIWNLCSIIAVIGTMHYNDNNILRSGIICHYAIYLYKPENIIFKTSKFKNEHIIINYCSSS